MLDKWFPPSTADSLSFTCYVLFNYVFMYNVVYTYHLFVGVPLERPDVQREVLRLSNTNYNVDFN